MDFSLSRLRRGLAPDMASLEHLAALSESLGAAVDRVAQMLGSTTGQSADLEVALNSIDADATSRHMALMTSLRSAFISPLPRQDLYQFSDLLNRAVEQVCNAGLLIRATEQFRLPAPAMDLLEILGRQAELFTAATGQFRDLDAVEETWIQMQRACKRSDRILTTWISGMSGDLLQRTYHQQREVAHSLESTVDTLRDLVSHLGRVLVRES
ncbi:hypothetical protein [Micrococcus terreus]|uniref:Nuclease PIN n=1 Tax=Micrococcus terreus TaxID=574650 RepID=A0A1I7MQQ8_9MICC|nr:hypothetical protein [Micrococcus terreus]SFV24246.1 hypothetical protein SAMN04487966_11062 [Micrococcus terreus]